MSHRTPVERWYDGEKVSNAELAAEISRKDEVISRLEHVLAGALIRADDVRNNARKNARKSDKARKALMTEIESLQCELAKLKAAHER